MTRPLRAAGNRYLQQALDGLPNYRKALAIAGLVDEKLAALAPAPAVPPELDPFATGDLTEKWIEANLAHQDAQERLNKRRNFLIGEKQRAEAEAQTICEAGLDRMLAELHKELARLLDEAAQLADQLDGANSAELAIANDRGPAWKRLCQLADEHDLLRTAQQVVMLRHAPDHYRSAQSAGGEETASDLILSNLDAVWPSWRTPGQGAERVILIDSSAVHRYEPWPEDRTELLHWMVTSRAQPWIPTTVQLDALWRRRRERLNPNPKPIGPRPPLNKTLPQTQALTQKGPAA